MSEKLETVGWVECDMDPELGFLGLVLHPHYFSETGVTLRKGGDIIAKGATETEAIDAAIKAQQAAEIERDDWEGREAIIADVTNELLKGVGK